MEWRVKNKEVKMKKRKMNKKQAGSVQLSDSKPQDVKAIENLKDLAKALPACSDITGAARFLCEKIAPKITEKYLAIETT